MIIATENCKIELCLLFNNETKIKILDTNDQASCIIYFRSKCMSCVLKILSKLQISDLHFMVALASMVVVAFPDMVISSMSLLCTIAELIAASSLSLLLYG